MSEVTNVGVNIAEKSTVIWNVADMLRGPFKPHEYGLVILPMTVIKRFHDCLLPTREKVLETYGKVKELAVKDGFLKKASGYQFYNTSPFTFKTLVADPENIEDNFKAYLNGFSDNVLDILARMDFTSQINRMVEGGLLYQVISDFNSEKADFSPENVTAVDMGSLKTLFNDSPSLITRKRGRTSPAGILSILCVTCWWPGTGMPLKKMASARLSTI